MLVAYGACVRLDAYNRIAGWPVQEILGPFGSFDLELLSAPGTIAASPQGPPAKPLKMSQPVMRATINVLPRAATRQCLRSLSTASNMAARRPTTSCLPKPQAQTYQPLVQRRFKFKTVEEAKSRYRSGVCIGPVRCVFWTEANMRGCSHSHGRLVFSSS